MIDNKSDNNTIERDRTILIGSTITEAYGNSFNVGEDKIDRLIITTKEGERLMITAQSYRSDPNSLIIEDANNWMGAEAERKIALLRKVISDQEDIIMQLRQRAGRSN